MPLNKSTVKNASLAPLCYNDILTCPFGIHSSLTDGIPSYRIVYLNTEAKNTNGETLTDNGSVGYAATADATTVVAGIVKDGCDLTKLDNVTYHPGFNRDFNVSVTLLGTMIVEVLPGEAIAVGTDIEADPVGLATAVGNGGGATGIIALSASAGSGTATNPEYIIALVK